MNATLLLRVGPPKSAALCAEKKSIAGFNVGTNNLNPRGNSSPFFLCVGRPKSVAAWDGGDGVRFDFSFFALLLKSYGHEGEQTIVAFRFRKEFLWFFLCSVKERTNGAFRFRKFFFAPKVHPPLAEVLSLQRERTFKTHRSYKIQFRFSIETRNNILRA